MTIASTSTSPYTAISHESKPVFGVQFHPEVSHSPKGKEVIKAFVTNVCGIKGGWSMVSFILANALLQLMILGLIHPERDCTDKRDMWAKGTGHRGRQWRSGLVRSCETYARGYR